MTIIIIIIIIIITTTTIIIIGDCVQELFFPKLSTLEQ